MLFLYLKLLILQDALRDAHSASMLESYGGTSIDRVSEVVDVHHAKNSKGDTSKSSRRTRPVSANSTSQR
jgi:hypothetical protein